MVTLNKKTSTGFTIIEVVVTMAVVGMMIIALTNLVISVGAIQRQTERLSLASRVAEAKIESLRNNHYNNLTNSPPPIDFTSELPEELPSPRSAYVTVSEPAEGIKRVDVVITYHDGNVDRQVQL